MFIYAYVKKCIYHLKPFDSHASGSNFNTESLDGSDWDAPMNHVHTAFGPELFPASHMTIINHILMIIPEYLPSMGKNVSMTPPIFFCFVG